MELEEKKSNYPERGFVPGVRASGVNKSGSERALTVQIQDKTHTNAHFPRELAQAHKFNLATNTCSLSLSYIQPHAHAHTHAPSRSLSQ